MADEATHSPPNVEGGRKGNKITQFIKKNKTLSAVVAAGGIYYLLKSQGEGGGGGEELPLAEGEYNEGGPLNEIGSVNSRQEYNELTAEERERFQEEKERLREEEQEDRERERENKERTPEEKEPVEPGEPITPYEPIGTTDEHGISIHGKNFANATSSRIAGTGKTAGGKAYIEYAINFPGRVEHWQYFTASGNWRKANASNEGAGSNSGSKTPTTPNKPTTGPNGGSSGGGAGATGKPKVAVGGAKAVAPPAPKPAPVPAPARAPECAPGTVGNILHARGEVQRLQGEINSLQASKPKGWAANVAGKQALRDQFQGTVDRGRQQPGCGNV